MIGNRFAEVNHRLTQLENRLVGVGNGLHDVQGDVNGINNRLTELTSIVDANTANSWIMRANLARTLGSISP